MQMLANLMELHYAILYYFSDRMIASAQARPPHCRKLFLFAALNGRFFVTSASQILKY